MRSIPQNTPTLFDGKNCSKCGKWKLLTEFHAAPKARTWDGLRPDCKECRRAYNHQHYTENQDRMRQYALDHHAQHREERNEKNRARWQAKRDQYRQTQRRYYAQNREAIRE